MSRYRLEISKGEEVRFVSHLDLMKSFERALRRAEIPVSFSEGFNPHPKIAFGSALPVGVTSSCELVDIELKEEMDTAELSERLKEALPPGLRLNSIRVLESAGPALMAVINKSQYEVLVRPEVGQVVTDEELQQAINKFLSGSSVTVEKRTKKGPREVDIRPGVFQLTGQLAGDEITLQMELQTGSSGNIRAEDVLAGLAKMGLPLERDLAKVHRTGLSMG